MLQEKQSQGRPTADELLERICRNNRGKLTVFLGAAAGVGKTYTMLEAAHERLREGQDLVIGWVETHGRQETEKMVVGLPTVDPVIIEYRGKQLKEMNIDQLISRKPELVLVDELAHTNIPGSRHVRRYQDVEELLEAGINVYTTLNIQHIESLNDIVAQITGVIVRETVPDYVVEQADTVQLIDISSEDLIKRLKEGKVYLPGQAEKALKKFFRPGNINALRELSLRFTAQRVDKDLADYMREHQIKGPWPAAGRVMVCVSASPFSAQLIRAARRLSAGLQAELLAVHIEARRPRFPMGEKERDRIANNMRLAEELGAKTLTMVGEKLTDEILDIARSHNVSAIVVGKPRHSRFWEMINGSVVDKIIRQSDGLNVYVIQGQAETDEVPIVKTAARPRKLSWLYYAGGLAMVGAVTGLSWLFSTQLELVDIALLYLLPVLLSAVWWGRWPSYVTAAACVLSFDFLFVPPILTFTVNDIRYLWSFVIFLAVSFIIGGRTERLKVEASAARQQEKSTRAVYEFTKEIAAVIDINTIAGSLARQAGETIERKIVVLLPNEQDQVMVHSAHDFELGQEVGLEGVLTDAEKAVAAWVYQNGQVAGRSTDTLPGGQYLYVPLSTQGQVLGVIGVCIAQRKLTPGERRLVDAWAGLAAVAIERVKLVKQARTAELLMESDRLHNALFSSISHELRTPLAAVIGSVSTLLEAGHLYTQNERHELLENMRDGAVRMERLIANLLDTARLESGMMQLKTDWCDIEDIIGAALRRLDEHLKEDQVKVQLAPALPLLRADCVLVEQVLVNLIDNAVKHSSGKGIVLIEVEHVKDRIMVSVINQGFEIPLIELTRIFDKFYRIKQSRQVSGTGLGLSICKGIVEAHKGRIWAENVQNGVAIRFELPVYSEAT